MLNWPTSNIAPMTKRQRRVLRTISFAQNSKWLPRFWAQAEITTHLHSKTSKASGGILPLPQLKVKVKNGKECFAPWPEDNNAIKIQRSRENLEFEGAKSSFQKGLGSKSRFLEKSKISCFWGLKPSLDIKFELLSYQRWSGNSKISFLMTYEKIDFFKSH